jgi:hypothetical protein
VEGSDKAQTFKSNKFIQIDVEEFFFYTSKQAVARLSYRSNAGNFALLIKLKKCFDLKEPSKIEICSGCSQLLEGSSA